MARRLAAAAALVAGAAVAAGAFGAHALATRLDARGLELWRTADRYLATAALGALATAAVALAAGVPAAVRGGWLVLAGGILFALSLFALALGAPRALGAVTPLGGLAMIAGFLLVAASLMRGGASRP